jgi:hypothetical protein
MHQLQLKSELLCLSPLSLASSDYAKDKLSHEGRENL